MNIKNNFSLIGKLDIGELLSRRRQVGVEVMRVAAQRALGSQQNVGTMITGEIYRTPNRMTIGLYVPGHGYLCDCDGEFHGLISMAD